MQTESQHAEADLKLIATLADENEVDPKGLINNSNLLDALDRLKESRAKRREKSWC